MENLRQQFLEKRQTRELELSCPYVVQNWHIKKFSKRINYYILWQHLLQIELDDLIKVFVEINDYPSKTVENIIKNKLERENVDITDGAQTNATDNSETKLQLFLPKQIKKRIPSNVKTCIT